MERYIIYRIDYTISYTFFYIVIRSFLQDSEEVNFMLKTIVFLTFFLWVTTKHIYILFYESKKQREKANPKKEAISLIVIGTSLIIICILEYVFWS